MTDVVVKPGARRPPKLSDDNFAIEIRGVEGAWWAAEFVRLDGPASWDDAGFVWRATARHSDGRRQISLWSIGGPVLASSRWSKEDLLEFIVAEYRRRFDEVVGQVGAKVVLNESEIAGLTGANVPLERIGREVDRLTFHIARRLPAFQSFEQRGGTQLVLDLHPPTIWPVESVGLEEPPREVVGFYDSYEQLLHRRVMSTVAPGIVPEMQRCVRLGAVARRRIWAMQPFTGGAMSLGLLDDFGFDFTLVKPDGHRVAGRGIWGKGRRTIIVHDKTFPVGAGDAIEHVLPNGNVERYDVTDPGYQPAPAGSDMEHYEIKIRHTSVRPVPAPTNIVNHHYNNSGLVNAMGPDAVASHNTNNISITQQTLNLSDPRIPAELAEVRKALAAEVDDDDAAIELGNVVAAQNALKDGNEGRFRAAMKRLGTKAWNVAEKLALAWMTNEGRHQLGLPPG